MDSDSHFDPDPDFHRYETVLGMADLMVHHRSLPELFAEIAERLRDSAAKGTVPRKVGSALVMGATISAMPYTAMAATGFMPSAVLPDLSHTASISVLGAVGVAMVTLLVLSLAVSMCAADRRLAGQARGRPRLHHSGLFTEPRTALRFTPAIIGRWFPF
jgi:hypothetical protein